MSNSAILLVARILLSVMFIMSGIQKFTDIAGTAGYIGSIGLPAAGALAWLAAIFETFAGIAILIGFQTRLVSYLMAVFCVVLAALFHSNFGDMTQMIMFMKNLTIAGGFLALSVAGPGGISLDGRRG